MPKQIRTGFMDHKIRKRLAFISTIIFVLSLTVTGVQGFAPYTGYTYDEFNKPVPSMNGYEPSGVYYGSSDGSVVFDSVTDMFVDSRGHIFLLDGPRARIVEMDPQYEVVRMITEFRKPDGTIYSLNGPQGFFLTENNIYIADSDNYAVVVSDWEGNISKVVGKPESEIFPQEKEFRPIAVISDSVGNIYTVISGVFQGAPTFDREGNFIEFFGSDRVELTARLLADLFWKRIVNDEMRDRLSRYVPLEYRNFDIDSENFIYTCAIKSTSLGELRKINPAGVNIWPVSNYGDLEVNYRKGRSVDTAFNDVEIGSNGFLYALDDTRKRIFVYDKEGELTFVFGGKGNQKGTFQMPSAIESFGDKIYIYDSSKFSITEMVPNTYGKTVMEAIKFFQDGRYIESRSLWEDVLRQNTNNRLAYIGIGKALYHTGDYDEAMKYHTLGGAKSQESLAFEQFRSDLIRHRFSIIVVLVVCMILVIAAAVNRRKLSVLIKSLRKGGDRI